MDDAIPEAPWLTRLLRIVALVVLAISLFAAVIAFLPGREVYDFEVHIRTENAGGKEIVGVLLPFVIGALVLLRRPSLRVAFFWPLIVFTTAIVWAIGTFELNLTGERHVLLWPATAVAVSFTALGGILLSLFVGAPIFVGARTLVRWRRVVRTERERLPQARLL